MPSSSARILKLLSLLSARPQWAAEDLARHLEVSDRTIRRDVETLRDLGYPIGSTKGAGGGYRLGVGGRLPPVIFDDEQAIATAVALQTAPAAIAGMQDATARSLATLRHAMPDRLRAEADALNLTALRNYWEFPAPPIDSGTLRAVGGAVREGHILRFQYADQPRVQESDQDLPIKRVEPHRLVLWAARWYLIAYDLTIDAWAVLRVDRIRPRDATHRPFNPRPLPDPDIGQYVMTRPDRGDTPAEWQCQGSVILDLPASVVARYAPGGSVVDALGPRQTRLTVGGWSWVGLAGIILTFDVDCHDPRPVQLADAFAALRRRLQIGVQALDQPS